MSNSLVKLRNFFLMPLPFLLQLIAHEAKHLNER
jgi:hypothetical protein